ncbi:hypothetical protein ElyMa_001213500 [Elysia marginata]|uniref:Uncharacterized protein n=1 Tax=Elysia marginata TaxID=1093978 RepID=A0AAV4I916_9GAST|nr:hypothetical protein ElyMa_001213500 [Elysia marginata]
MPHHYIFFHLNGISENSDAKYDDLPKLSLMAELWYFTNASAASFHQDCRSRSPPMINRSSPYFRLACFRHLLHTWLADAGGLGDMWISDSYLFRYQQAKPETLLKTCSALLDEIPSELPNYVIEVMVKLSMVLPDILEKSINSKYMRLTRGFPGTLFHRRNLKTELQSRGLSGYAKPGYSLEIFSADTLPDRSIHCILILFYPKTFTVWSGRVDCYYLCKPRNTTVIRTIDANSSLQSLKKEVRDIVSAFDDTLIKETWHCIGLFPGVCDTAHRVYRHDVCELLNSRIRLLARTIDSLVSRIALQHSHNSRNIIPSKLQGVLEMFKVQVYYRHPGSYACYSTAMSPFLFQDSLRISKTYVRLVDAIRSSLHIDFQEELDYFDENNMRHVLFKLSHVSLRFWPFHMIVKGLEVLDNALKICDQL